MSGVPAKEESELETEVAPLTRADPQRQGQAYRRQTNVETQIKIALVLAPAQLVERARLRDYHSPDYFQEECLVYLIREHHRLNHQELVDALAGELSGRCEKHIDSKIRAFLAPTYIEDCFNDAVAALFEQIIDLDSDRGDFAQVYFWVFLDARILNVSRVYLKRQIQDRKTTSVNAQKDDDDYNPSVSEALKVKEDIIIDNAQIIESLDVLDEPIRTAFFMRHYVGWEIENKDPEVFTISRYFNKSSRQIRRWLKDADEMLRLRRGEKQ
jgi:hypothetical protein